MVVGLLFIVVGLLAAMVKAQSDTWWQLRSGQHIWETQHVTFADPYSHTARGQYWPNHEWLTELIFYGMHRAGGMPMLALFTSVTPRQ